MTIDEWDQCKDARPMLELLWNRMSEDDLVPVLHNFLVKSARRIEILLPQTDSVCGIDIAEKYLAGLVSEKALWEQNWYTEAAAFTFDFAKTSDEIDEINQWMFDVTKIPRAELDDLLIGVQFDDLDTYKLLSDAAFFVDHAMTYHTASHKRNYSSDHQKFLSPDLLRSLTTYPACSGNDPIQ